MSGEDIPALSLWQPWAHAVCHLGKRIENRERWHEGTPQLSQARKLVGSTILIHAAKACGTRDEYAVAVAAIVNATLSSDLAATLRGIAGSDLATPAPSLPRMALVARATLADVVRTLDNGHRVDSRGPRVGELCGLCVRDVAVGKCPKADPWALPGVGLVLTNVVPFETPIPYPGRQGWFRVPAEVTR